MARSKNRKLKSRSFKVRVRPAIFGAILGIFLIIASGATALSFSQTDGFLGQINQQIRTWFGPVAIILPFALLQLGLLLLRINFLITFPHVVVGTQLLFLTITALAGSGEVGVAIWESLVQWITTIPTLLLLIISLLLSLMVMFNITFEQGYLLLLKTLHGLRNLLEKIVPQEENPDILELSTTSTKKEFKVKGMLEPGTTPATSSPISAVHPVLPKVSTHTKDLKIAAPANPEDAAKHPWKLPPVSLLSSTVPGTADRGDVKRNAQVIEDTLQSFGINANVVEVNLGPAVTQYALEVTLGTKLSKILSLGSDLALALAAPTGQIRIEAPIPGRSLVGIELPNRAPETVGLRKILESPLMRDSTSKTYVALGRDVSGNPQALDITKMPHLLIAGSTGSGKSVCVNSIICSILFRSSPTEVKFIMVDPKRVELTQYNGIPHLLTPVIVDVDKVPSALQWCIHTMTERYKQFAEVGARNISSYNQTMGYQAIPYIFVIIDELADVMMMAPKQTEESICRLAQMARATGIHLVIATQRPSVDVITGLIKANIPARIAFAVSSMTDSRVIIDGPGAEKLLGKGDMLYIPPDQAKPARIQGTWVTDPEINKLISFVKGQGIAPVYTEEITAMASTNMIGGGKSTGDGGDDNDPVLLEAMRVIMNDNKASASYLQRKLSVGYARAARILDQLEAKGVVGPVDGAKPREIRTDIISQILAGQQ